MAVDNIARGMAAKALENQSGGGSSLPIVNTATVGQTIRVFAVDDAGKPTEWEATDLPEPVQSNFNQNDDTAPDYIKNRTHYDASFYLDTSHIYGHYDFNSYFGFVRISEGVIDIPGDGLKAEYNGNVYDVSILEHPYYGNSTTYEIEIDGNKYTVAVNVAKENAVIYVYYNGTQYEINNPNLGTYVIYDPSSMNSVRASLYTEDVHKLDPKYLPDEIKTLVVTYSDDGEHATHTSSEIYEAHEKGRVVQFVDYDSSVHQPVFVSTDYVVFVSIFDSGKSIVFVQDSYVSQDLLPQLVVSNTASVGQTIQVKSIDENGKPTEWEAVDMVSIPDVTAADNGKFLRVVNGAWAASTVPNAEEASF